VISAGNDIVALKVIDKERTHQPVFYSKFITPAEFEIHRSTEMPFMHFVWLLWSVKESAYKYLKRSDAGLVFSPSKLIVQQIIRCTHDEVGQFTADQEINDFYSGTISYDLQKLPFKSAINNKFIVSSINNGDVYWGVQKIESNAYDDQSTAVRQFALDCLNNLLALNNLQFENHPAGYPVLFNGELQTDVAVSFAHHDRYVSYSLHIPK